MLKMKFWFEGNQLQPDCNIHGGCKIGVQPVMPVLTVYG